LTDVLIAAVMNRNTLTQMLRD